MKSILAASPAMVLAGALLAAPAFAQTMTQPAISQPMVQPYAGNAAPPADTGTTAQPYAGQMMQQQTVQAALPQGDYLSTCKDARMLQDTLTAFCSKGDGTWQTTQLWHVENCTGGVQNAGGQLVCGMAPQVGSSVPPQSYDSAYGAMTPAATGGAAPAYTPGSTGPTYAAPTYNGYATPGVTYDPNAPAADQYYSPSASKTARPYGY